MQAFPAITQALFREAPTAGPFHVQNTNVTRKPDTPIKEIIAMCAILDGNALISDMA